MGRAGTQRMILPFEAPTVIPFPQLTERLSSLDQLGLTTGRFGYRQCCYDNEFLGVRYGDVIKIDHRLIPNGIRGEIVLVEIHGNSIETMGVLEAWSGSILDVWTGPNECKRGSLADCVPRKVVGKIQLEPSQRLFLMRGYAKASRDPEGIKRLNEVLKPRPSCAKQNVSAEQTLLAWLLSQPKSGRLLDLTSVLMRRAKPRKRIQNHPRGY